MKFWKTVAIFLGGVITGFLVIIKMKKPDTVINTETYIDEQTQKIGKIKQRGEGNKQDVELSQKTPSRKQLRKLRRETRKANRK